MQCSTGVISLGLLTEEGLLAKYLSWVLRLMIVSVNTSQGRSWIVVKHLTASGSAFRILFICWVVHRMIYPVTWDGAVRVWLGIILGCPILLVLFLFPLCVPFTRPRRLIPATYNVLFKSLY